MYHCGRACPGRDVTDVICRRFQRAFPLISAKYVISVYIMKAMEAELRKIGQDEGCYLRTGISI